MLLFGGGQNVTITLEFELFLSPLGLSGIGRDRLCAWLLLAAVTSHYSCLPGLFMKGCRVVILPFLFFLYEMIGELV